MTSTTDNNSGNPSDLANLQSGHLPLDNDVEQQLPHEEPDIIKQSPTTETDCTETSSSSSGGREDEEPAMTGVIVYKD